MRTVCAVQKLRIRFLRKEPPPKSWERYSLAGSCRFKSSLAHQRQQARYLRKLRWRALRVTPCMLTILESPELGPEQDRGGV